MMSANLAYSTLTRNIISSLLMSIFEMDLKGEFKHKFRNHIQCTQKGRARKI